MVISGETEWGPCSFTSLFWQQKCAVYLDMALVTPSLLASLLGYNQGWELRSSLISSMYFKLLSSTGLIFKKSICITLLGCSPCSAETNSRVMCSSFLSIVQWMHARVNSLPFRSNFFFYQEVFCFVSSVAAYAPCSCPRQWGSTLICSTVLADSSRIYFWSFFLSIPLPFFFSSGKRPNLFCSLLASSITICFMASADDTISFGESCYCFGSICCVLLIPFGPANRYVC